MRFSNTAKRPNSACFVFAQIFRRNQWLWSDEVMIREENYVQAVDKKMMISCCRAKFGSIEKVFMSISIVFKIDVNAHFQLSSTFRRKKFSTNPCFGWRKLKESCISVCIGLLIELIKIRDNSINSWSFAMHLSVSWCILGPSKTLWRHRTFRIPKLYRLVRQLC